jgi:dipeptidyl aminopeptidase/acylaminoacyl peptidase
MFRRLFAAVALVCAAMPLDAVAAPPLEVYGRLPHIADVEIAPDGRTIAYLAQGGGHTQVVVQRIDDGEILRRLDFQESKIRGLRWVDNNFVLIYRSVANFGDPIRFEWPQVVALNVETGETEQLLDVNYGITNVGIHDGRPVVYMFNRAGLLRVDVRTGRAREHFSDNSSGVSDYQVEPDGTVVLYERYDRPRWELYSLNSGTSRRVTESRASLDVPSFWGMSADGRDALVRYWNEAELQWRAHPVSLETGDIGEPITPDTETGVMFDYNRHMIGTYRTTLFTAYDFIDPELDTLWGRISGSFPASQVYLTSFTPDFSRLVVYVEGTGRPGSYFIYDAASASLTAIGNAYPEITPEDVAEVRHVRYRASDGFEVPAFLTLPPGRSAQNLPLVVLPHGGPASRDTVGFDWVAQAFASRGYAVLQPNFRGSTGYGHAHLSAGYGEWGRRMQTDLSDGIAYLAGRGMVDPSRVCIFGMSYGGYAALAGVTLQNGIYRCAVSVAGVSDVQDMLEEDQRLYGSTSTTMRWQFRYIGVDNVSDPSLQGISPLRQAGSGTAPVLLIHGRDDSIVPYRHSQRMERALREAGRAVEFVELREEDHGLSREPTRIQALTAAVAFIERHNPPN